MGAFSSCNSMCVGILFFCIVKDIGMKKNVIIFCFGIIFGAVLFWVVSRLIQLNGDSVVQCTPNYREIRESGYEYIQPLLECDVDQRSDKYESLRVDLEQILRSLDVNTDSSIYFRDLNSGLWVGINENQSFAPASMAKMYVFLAAFKKQSASHGFFDEEFVYRNQFIKQRNLDEEEHKDVILVEGEKYTVSDLLVKMIVYSDNESYWSLHYLLNKKYPGFLNELKSGLLVGDNGLVSLKNFSHMFRLLYNSTYLPREESQAAIQLLTQTSFKDGLVAGVPESVKVASKFGFYDPDPQLKEPYRFNHCGIVYHSTNPYLLCLSIPSTSLDDFRESMKQAEDISSAVFTWVDTHEVTM